MQFKSLEGKLGRENPKKIISTSGGLGLLQMILEPNIGWCVNEDAGPKGSGL